MKQLFFIEPGKVEWRETATPELLEATDALVRPLAVATCDLDTGLVHGLVPFKGPFPLGHEGVGEVVEVGSEVSGLSVGDRVIIPFQISCGRCRRCRTGLTASCEAVTFGAMYGLEPFGGSWGGFLSDLVRIPWADFMLVPLPSGVDPATVASLSDNISDGWRTVAPYVEDPVATSVLVVGGRAPSIPFYAVATARALGVGTVDFLSYRDGAGNTGYPGDIEKATRLGARVLEPGQVPSNEYTLTVCSTPDLGALRLALRTTEPDGICVCNTIFFGEDVRLPMFSMYTRGVQLVTGRVNVRQVIPQALSAIVSGALQPEMVTDAIIDWADAPEALVGEPQKLVFLR